MKQLIKHLPFSQKTINRQENFHSHHKSTAILASLPLAGFEFLKEQFIEANKVQVKKKGNSRRNAAPAEEEKKEEEILRLAKFIDFPRLKRKK